MMQTFDPNAPLPRVTLVLGGARSGKSALAEKLIEGAGGGIYLATGEARDAEMTARIAQHRARRGKLWRTVESPVDLVGPLSRETGPILIDCLTLWLSNLMEHSADVENESRRLTDCLTATEGPVVLIANEVGLGIVPDNALARRFRDATAHLNQQIATCSNQVIFVAAGLPLRFK